MLLSISGSLWKHTKPNWITENWNFCRNISAFMMKEVAREMEIKEKEIDQYAGSSGEDSDDGSNLFKAVFKKYKKRKPPPDVSDVIDVKSSSLLQSKLVFSTDEITSETTSLAERLGLIAPSEWRVYWFPDRIGLYLLPSLLRKEKSTMWMKRAFKYAEPPNITNLTLHGKDVLTDPTLLTKGLRWTTLGVEYDWNSKEYPPNGRPVPEELYQLGNLISRSLKLGDMKPDATILNYYPPKSALSPHVDKSERSAAPLISMSLGQTAIYLSGTIDLSSEPPIPIWLRNGDFLIMHGDQRLVYHAIPCIGSIPKRRGNRGSMMDEDQEHFEPPRGNDDVDQSIIDYLNSSRVNFTIRQVNPS